MLPSLIRSISFFFFFNDTATTEIYTLSLHDALPICRAHRKAGKVVVVAVIHAGHLGRLAADQRAADRKSTRLNSSHMSISYAVFCLKKKKNKKGEIRHIYILNKKEK